MQETPKEIALLVGGVVEPDNKVKRYRLRRDTAAELHKKVWNTLHQSDWKVEWKATNPDSAGAILESPDGSERQAYLFVNSQTKNPHVFTIYAGIYPDIWTVCYSKHLGCIHIYDGAYVQELWMRYRQQGDLKLTLDSSNAVGVIKCRDNTAGVGYGSALCAKLNSSKKDFSLEDFRLPDDAHIAVAPNEIPEDVQADLNREEAMLSDEDPGCEIGCACDMCEEPFSLKDFDL